MKWQSLPSEGPHGWRWWQTQKSLEASIRSSPPFVSPLSALLRSSGSTDQEQPQDHYQMLDCRPMEVTAPTDSPASLLIVPQQALCVLGFSY